eukprot:CAMPEP_0197013268 /NCGR_PEP_ID=MMETSP1380-20130617/65756_1 /TAXON_ID=5936 /ORGANISM="Euplotes crassus, Strain CT5" /LENGTH=292 /DNA_ID=CAMNT_0042437405 /DNA_START=74 /DNA_END=948 /DNA_ORIENTATION=-
MVMVFFVVVMPFFLGYLSQNFYKKSGIYFEMPKVSFLKEFAIETVEVTASATSTKFFTTVPTYTHKNYNTLAPPYFSYYKEDQDNDDHPEKFVFDINIRGNPESLTLALAFQYDIDEIIESKMKNMVYINVNDPNGISKVDAYGVFALAQRSPRKNEYQESVIYNSSPLDKVLNSSLTQLYKDYLSRQEYAYFSGNTVVSPYGDSNMVQIHLEVSIPKLQEIRYTPALLESLKSAWVQYIYILIPFYIVLILLILRFILSNQIIETHIFNNLPTKKDLRWYRKFRELMPNQG